jgi:hypothetical protein
MAMVIFFSFFFHRHFYKEKYGVNNVYRVVMAACSREGLGDVRQQYVLGTA